MSEAPKQICAGPDSEHGWLHAHASSVLAQDGVTEYTRSDLCVTPSEAEALRAENMALRGAYERGVRDAALIADGYYSKGQVTKESDILTLLAKQEADG